MLSIISIQKMSIGLFLMETLRRLLSWISAISLSFSLSIILCGARQVSATVPLLTDGAENGTSNILVNAPTGYSIISGSVYADPAPRSFHLTNPGFTDQWIELKSSVTPQTGSQLSCKTRMCYASPYQSGNVLISTDNGGHWTYVFRQFGDSTVGTGTFVPQMVDLSPYAGQSIRIRFSYEIDPNGLSAYFQTADSYGWYVDQIIVRSGDGSTLLSEGAETGLVNININVPNGYNLFSSAVFADTTFHSFHLTNPGFTDQWIELKSSVTPQTGSQLSCKTRMCYASPYQSGNVLISTDNGGHWTYVFRQFGDSTVGTGTFVPQMVDLSPYAGQSIRIRFSYEIDPNGLSAYFQTADSYGWYVDQISVSAGDSNSSPTISGSVAGQAISDNATIRPFTGVTIVDADVPAQTQAVSVTLDTAAKGSFTALGGFTNVGGGVYTFSGTAAAATTAIRGLVFAPTATYPMGTITTTTLTINTNDRIAPTMTNSTTTVITTSVNHAPVANPQTLCVIQDVAKQGTLTAAADTEGNPLAYSPVFSIITQGAKGAVVLDNASAGAFTYTPTPTATGSDSFTFKVTDPTVTLVSNEATVRVEIPKLIAPAVSSSVSGLRITWPSVEGKTYTIECSTDFRGPFNPIATVSAAPSPAIVTHWTDIASSSASQMFYCIRTGG